MLGTEIVGLGGDEIAGPFQESSRGSGGIVAVGEGV